MSPESAKWFVEKDMLDQQDAQRARTGRARTRPTDRARRRLPCARPRARLGQLMTERAPTIVFDLDGTLADTAPDLIATLNTLLLRENLPRQQIGTARPFVG